MTSSAARNCHTRESPPRDPSLARIRIEKAALDLALGEGIRAATVAAITERAGVSQRTFHHHFRTSWCALLGLARPESDEEMFLRQTAITHDLDPIIGVIGLVTNALSITGQASCLIQPQREEIIRRYPEAFATHLPDVHARRRRLIAQTAAILAAQHVNSDDAEATPHAPLVFAACAQAIRSATRTYLALYPARAIWRNTTSQPPIDTVEEIQQQAIILIENAIANLTQPALPPRSPRRPPE